MTARAQYTPWLHRFAIATALATIILIGFGGLVTSKGVGMAVPDWPNTFGYNMFLVPFDQWLGKFGVFEEHSHRLVASFVGLLTIILAIWICVKDDRKWVRRLGIVAVLLVVGQGVLGGLRVTEINPNLGLIHGAVAQLFLILICGIALVTSGWWHRPGGNDRAGFVAIQGRLVVVISLIFVQLLLGATMRHQHAGLAIWDFPLAHGQAWPATDEASVARYNNNRSELQKSLHAANQLLDRRGIRRRTSPLDTPFWRGMFGSMLIAWARWRPWPGLALVVKAGGCWPSARFYKDRFRTVGDDRRAGRVGRLDTVEQQGGRRGHRPRGAGGCLPRGASLMLMAAKRCASSPKRPMRRSVWAQARGPRCRPGGDCPRVVFLMDKQFKRSGKNRWSGRAPGRSLPSWSSCGDDDGADHHAGRVLRGVEWETGVLAQNLTKGGPDTARHRVAGGRRVDPQPIPRARPRRADGTHSEATVAQRGGRREGRCCSAASLGLRAAGPGRWVGLLVAVLGAVTLVTTCFSTRHSNASRSGNRHWGDSRRVPPLMGWAAPGAGLIPWVELSGFCFFGRCRTSWPLPGCTARVRKSRVRDDAQRGGGGGRTAPGGGSHTFFF
ncbi:MAG: hypothetical protein CM1200mP34_5580 [Verrucomicrobiales bacterium]|nr:MAG: hypothetical protein CM1200mP34_5580 [Verrucomicrobiales bacterium]